MKTDVHFLLYLVHFFSEWKIFQTNVVEKIKTHIFIHNNVFFFVNRAVYEIVWNDPVEPERPQLTTPLMRIACCIYKATNTDAEFVIFIAFALQKSPHERASILRHMYIACPVNNEKSWWTFVGLPVTIDGSKRKRNIAVKSACWTCSEW